MSSANFDTTFVKQDIDFNTVLESENQAFLEVSFPLKGEKGEKGEDGQDGASQWGQLTGTLSDQTDLQSVLDAKTDDVDLAVVAKTGSYDDLSDKPAIPDTSNLFDKTTDDLDDITAGTTNKHFTDTEKSKLAGIEDGAQVNVTPDATDVTFDSEDFDATNVDQALNELRDLIPIPLGDWNVLDLSNAFVDVFSTNVCDLGTDGFAVLIYRIEDNMVKGFLFGVIDTDNNMGAPGASLWIVDPDALPERPSNIQGFTFAIPSKFGYMSVFPDEFNAGLTGLMAVAFPDLSGGFEEYASMAFVGDLPVTTSIGFETLHGNGRLADLTGRFATFQIALEYPISGTFVTGADFVS